MISEKALPTFGRSSIRRLATFGAIGLFNTAAFFVLANIFNYAWAFGETSAAYVSYAILMPVSFIGHRWLTFRSVGSVSKEWMKFCVIQVTNVLLIWIVTGLSHDYPLISGWPAFAFISMLVPILNFIVLQIWVFSASGNEKDPRAWLGREG
jgi:putative flippase GtrA